MKVILLASVLSLSACASLDSKVVAFEQKAAPVIERGCADLHAVEASVAGRLLTKGAEIGVGVAFGAAAGDAATLGVSMAEQYGDVFCAAGPPPGDTTSIADQAAWLGNIASGIAAAVK